ncbi:15-hydroxyprostaglandin dehydrogenase [Trichonephila clavipes]|nr:15-hydroxyprostaglandin dehydrogenase [Trichonephila clavipes]
MASAVLADPTRSLKGTNRGSGSAMEESENDEGSLKQLLLYADEHYLVGKFPLGDHLGKVMALQTITPAVREVRRRTLWGIVPLTRAPPHPYTVIICPKNKQGFITKHNI